MIHIFFVPGMFGSTVEYVLRNYTEEHIPVPGAILTDGSMHSFKKMNHIRDLNDVNLIAGQGIHTPIYPFRDQTLPDILKSYPISDTADQCLLIHARDFESAELNILFQYHKMVSGAALVLPNLLYQNAKLEDIKQWNKNYTQFEELQPWEIREWFSIFYPKWIQEWQDSQMQVPDNWLKIASGDILAAPEQTFESIIRYCNLTQKSGLREFTEKWQKAQQYIVDEYALINKIVTSSIEQRNFSWDKLNVFSEAIIQQKLRTKNFEIRCDGLNIFPTNSIDLYNLLESNLHLHQV